MPTDAGLCSVKGRAQVPQYLEAMSSVLQQHPGIDQPFSAFTLQRNTGQAYAGCVCLLRVPDEGIASRQCSAFGFGNRDPYCAVSAWRLTATARGRYSWARRPVKRSLRPVALFGPMPFLLNPLHADSAFVRSGD